MMETAEKSEVSKKESVSYDSKKDTSKRPELKSSVMAKKVERKLYPEPQVERKVSVVEVVKPVVEVIKEEEEEVAEPGTEGAAVEENSGSGSSKVSISIFCHQRVINMPVFETHFYIYSRRTRPPSRSRQRQRSQQGMYLLIFHSLPWLATTSPSSTTSLAEARRRNLFRNLLNQSHQGKLDR